MHADEKAIIEYLRAWPKTFVSGREIARKVGGLKRYEENRGWAIPILTELVRKGFIEMDHLGYFRLAQQDKDQYKKYYQRFVAPQILRILQTSGKQFDGIVLDDEDDDDDDEDNEKRTNA